jgi:hypothetical protein
MAPLGRRQAPPYLLLGLIAGVISARLEPALGRRTPFWSAAALMGAGPIGLTAWRIAAMTVSSVLVMGVGGGPTPNAATCRKCQPEGSALERLPICRAGELPRPVGSRRYRNDQ